MLKQKSEKWFDMEMETINAFVSVLIGLVFTPIIYNVAVNSGTSGTTAILLSLCPVIFIFIVLAISMKKVV